MTNSKSTKRALLTSALAMLMCVAMLIGTTFAWFTDTASTAVNKIQSGTLDVELWQAENDEKLSSDALKWVKADGHADEAVLWEPGCTYNLESFRIKNNGNLALKYKVIISGIVGDAKLLEAIDFTVKIGDADPVALANWDGTLAKEAVTDKITITGTMKTTAGNEYQNLTIDGISITVVATQDTVEYDSEGNTYDALAQYPVYTVADVTTKTESDKTVVASAVTIKSEEKTTVGTETVSVATATIPANVVLDNGATQVKLVVEDSKDTNNISITSDQAKKTLEVKLEGVRSDNTVPATVSFYIESGLTGLVLYHNNAPMTSVTSEGAVANNQEYYYDFATGKITMKSATFSPFTYVYDATVATTAELAAVTDDSAKTVTISSAKLLAGFAQSVNNGKSYAGYTITLTKDIDLAGREWTPIMLDGRNPDTGGKMITFDGKGHTISNFKVTAAAGVKNTGLFGTANFSIIKNLNVDNATVTGINHVGAIVGHGMVTKIDSCMVTNSTITTNVYNNDDGDKAGAVVGWVNEGINNITNCTVDKCTVRGYRDVGGLVGYVGTEGGTGQVVTGNSVTNTTVINDRTNNYKGYKEESEYDVHEIVGEYSGTLDTSNTATSVTIEVAAQ